MRDRPCLHTPKSLQGMWIKLQKKRSKHCNIITPRGGGNDKQLLLHLFANRHADWTLFILPPRLLIQLQVSWLWVWSKYQLNWNIMFPGRIEMQLSALLLAFVEVYHCVSHIRPKVAHPLLSQSLPLHYTVVRCRPTSFWTENLMIYLTAAATWGGFSSRTLGLLGKDKHQITLSQLISSTDWTAKGQSGRPDISQYTIQKTL